ncbi:serine/threonine-protein kinase [Thermococcus sp. 21S7]|uniref:serine/threonine-protein kinase n=1 Tax=Thermococcus sp. 21S7 TaxID=1638221 RepID=UPI00143BBB83|nr:serine/threonine-protein kinase [Thermococcus sp. 21S7]NJE60193.1 serine/threonine protein kinase [Thermococcus sp. 21S7]
MPKRKRSLEEDFIRRLFVSFFLIYILKDLGVVLAIFIFLPVIIGWVKRLEAQAASRPTAQPRPSVRDALRRGLLVEIPPELHPNTESRIRVGFRNVSGRTMRVEIGLENLARYGEVSPSRIRFTVRNGDIEYESIRFIPRKSGRIRTDVKVKSGIFLVRVPIELNVREPPGDGIEVAVSDEPKDERRKEYSIPNVKALFSRYRDVEPVGEGGFARVYRARRMDGKVVALKVPYHLTEQAGRAFLREVTVWSGLRHRNIVELYDANIVPVPYIEMEYCEGSLAKLDKPLHWGRVAELAFEICEGLKYAHSRGIIHRDLKPSNILLKAGIPKISDWGLSKVVTESRSTTTSFTPLYAAPEQISRSRFGPTDERTDVWQLGVLMYELVTGKVPFDGEDFVEIAGKITMEDPDPPSRLNPDAKPLDPIITKCLAKRKEERYWSVKELQKDLGELLGGKYRRELRKSVDLSRSTYYAGQLLLLHMKLGNTGEALKYALDLKRYASGEAGKGLEKLIEELEIRLNEGLPIPGELVERAEILVHEIALGPGKT